MNIPKQQNQYQLFKQAQGFSLNLIEGASIRAPGPKEVLVRVRASSLNRRYIMVLRGWYPVGDRSTVIPLSDGAGEIVVAILIQSLLRAIVICTIMTSGGIGKKILSIKHTAAK